MTFDRAPTADDVRLTCDREGCDAAADFRLYHPERDGWQPICERHAVSLHPSLEIHVWLESGYLRPIEVEAPAGPPDPPRGDRAAAFRALVEEAAGWTS